MTVFLFHKTIQYYKDALYKIKTKVICFYFFPNMTATRYPLRLNDERVFYLIRGFYKL